MPTTRAINRSRALNPRAALVAAIVFGVSMFVGAGPAYAAPVGLGTAESFAVLAGSGITNTGPTTITGDVGSFPTTSQTGFGSVTLNGTNHGGDAVTQGAKDDLVVAYNDAAGRTPVTNVPVELGGSTLLAGVYTSPTLGLTGTLTLDAQGDPSAQFVFQAGSTLIAETNSRVLLINGGDPCRVVWQVGSSATFKAGTRFVGDVLALTSITAQTAATFQGRLLARNGAVTLDTNTITKANCAAPADTTTTTTTVEPATTTTTTVAAAPAAPTSPTTPIAQGAVPLDATSTDAGIVNPAPTPGPVPSGDSSPAPTASPVVPLAPPLETPSGSPLAPPAPPRSPASPPLAVTGPSVFGLAFVGLALVVLGAVGVVAGWRTSGAHFRWAAQTGE